MIRGDDDDMTSFSQTQHSATISLAKIAVEDQIASLVSEQILPLEEAQGTLSLVASQRVYALASDFVRMQENYFVEIDGSGVSENSIIPEYKGGESAIRADIWDYQDVTGSPTCFYHTNGSSKSVGFYRVPIEAQDLRYYYEKDVLVSVEADTLPFQTNIESNTFVRMASRHFELLLEGTSDLAAFENDPVIISLRGTLSSLLNPRKQPERYGN